MSQLTTIQRLAEPFTLSNTGSPVLSPSGRDHARLSEIEKGGKENLTLSEASLGKSVSLAPLETATLLDLSSEPFIMGEIEKLAQGGFLGAAQGITGREKMAFLLS